MKILLTGGAGYIGSVVLRKLIGLNYKVHVFDNLIFGGESLIPFFHNPNFSFTKGDILDQKKVDKAMLGVYCVIHLAAIVGEHACKIHPEKSYDINFEGSKIVSSRAKKNKVKKFIFASTCSNYGISSNDTEADETAPLNPISEYAKAKVEAEKYILNLEDSNFHPAVLRLSTAYGLSARMRFDLLVSEFVKMAVINRKVVVYKPDAWRPLIHVEDIARAINLVIKSDIKKISGQVFNIGSKNSRKRDLLNYIKSQLPKSSVVIKEELGDKRDYKVSFEKAKKELGFKAYFSIEQGIDETISALKSGIFNDLSDPRFGNYKW